MQIANLRHGLAAVLATGVLVGCDSGTPLEPAPVGPEPLLVAFVGQEAGKPALYVQNADGSGRRRIHFAGAVELPGNPDAVPPVRDEYVLALGPLSWSPDGRRLAVVVTLAFDQSEVVVVDADGTNATVASLNTQIVLSGVDWSPDGKRLVYALSTRVGAAGVQVFTTDVDARTWRQVTNGAPVGSAGTDVRWASDGRILLWRTIGQTPAPEFDWVTRVSRVDPATGAAQVVLDSVKGMVQDVARDGTWAVVLRTASQAAGQDAVKDLVRMPLVGEGPERQLARGNLLLARLSTDDRALSLIGDSDPTTATTTYVASTLPVSGGSPRPLAGIDPGVYQLEALFR